MQITAHYDELADILTIRFTPPTDDYVHYATDEIATIHDAFTEEVIGLHIEHWSRFKAEMQEDSRKARLHIASKGYEDHPFKG